MHCIFWHEASWGLWRGVPDDDDDDDDDDDVSIGSATNNCKNGMLVAQYWNIKLINK